MRENVFYIICRKFNYENVDWSSVLGLTERVSRIPLGVASR